MTEHNNADQLDGSVLGESVGDEDLPGIQGYPPDRPLGVEDPTLLQGGPGARDDLVTRTWRETPDTTPAADAVDPTSDPGGTP